MASILSGIGVFLSLAYFLIFTITTKVAVITTKVFKITTKPPIFTTKVTKITTKFNKVQIHSKNSIILNISVNRMIPLMLLLWHNSEQSDY